MVLLGPQPALQISPPPVEELLGRGIESEERPLLQRQLLSADRSWVEHLHEPGEGSRAGRRDAQRPVASRAQLPRRVPAKTDRTSSWQFGRLPGALRAPGSLSDRGEPRVEVEPPGWAVRRPGP